MSDFRQAVDSDQRAGVNERFVRHVIEPPNQRVQCSEAQSADGFTLGETPFLIAVAGRQIEAIQQFAAEQINRGLELVGG